MCFLVIRKLLIYNKTIIVSVELAHFWGQTHHSNYQNRKASIFGGIKIITNAKLITHSTRKFWTIMKLSHTCFSVSAINLYVL